ncbi:MAG TPA: bifunctional metallophosphatase/5'-nucleotidase [Erysipelotrichaceae bacterium]|nr:bifunctional metallophosphatase/5'-nucleotidase [Erysipelotrichaceae bacterium]
MANRIRILATSDIHGYIFPHNYADNNPRELGLARLNTLIQALKDQNTLLIDNGDVLEGSALLYHHSRYHSDDISPASIVMKKIGYDYVNLGNHDFDHGMKALEKHLEYVDVPCITSNMDYRNKHFGPTYVIRQFGNTKVAIFGLTTQNIPRWVNAASIKGCKFRSAFDTAKRTVELLKDMERPDYIICVYHGGFERDLAGGYPTESLNGENEGYRILKEISGIDVLITGHQHSSMCGTKFNKVYIQPASCGKELACIDIYTDTHTIEPRLLKADADADEELLDLIRKQEEECQNWLDEPLGTCAGDLMITDQLDARVHKSQAVTFINQVQMEVTGAQLSMTALHSNAAGFHHDISMRDLVNTYLYPNTLIVKKINGRILKQLLENSAAFWSIRNDAVVVSPAFDKPSPKYYNYDMIDGVDYTIKVSNDVGERITDLTYQSQPVTDDMEFTLAINSYRASGKGGYDFISRCPMVNDIRKSIIDILADYIREHHHISFEPVSNIHIIR